MDQINTSMSDNNVFFSVLTETGDILKNRIIDMFKEIGFTNVIDVDQQENSHNLMEDIIIEDKDPILIIEVKGLNGSSSNDDTNVVARYVGRRRNFERDKNFHGLSIINTERLIDPQLRKREFNEEQRLDAFNFEYGIMQTWTFYQLFRGFKKWNWNLEVFKDIFYQSGEISPIPPFYHEIGTITNLFREPQVIEITLCNSISIGDKLAVYYQFRYFEFGIERIEINHVSVESATNMDVVGVKCPYLDNVSNNMIIYRVTIS